jgi:hypothetical protein
MFILLRTERIERFGYRDKRVSQIVSTSSPYSRTACFISGGEDSMKVDPDGVVLGSLASKVLRLVEQKAYITGGIIGIGREGEREGKRGKEREGGGRRGREIRKFNIRNNKRE